MTYQPLFFLNGDDKASLPMAAYYIEYEVMSDDVVGGGKTTVQRFYDVWGPLYTRLRDLGRDDHEDKSVLVDLISPFEADSVLDVGTGPGVYALRIAALSAGSEVIGIDISPAFVKIASERAAAGGVANADFRLGDIEALEFEDGRFSKVICAGVISVINDREAAIRELSRVLRPGGRLAMREPRRSEAPLARFFMNRPPGSRIRRLGSLTGLMFGHFSPDFLSDKELRSLFDEADFSEIVFQSHGTDLVIIGTK